LEDRDEEEEESLEVTIEKGRMLKKHSGMDHSVSTMQQIIGSNNFSLWEDLNGTVVEPISKKKFFKKSACSARHGDEPLGLMVAKLNWTPWTTKDVALD
jgi:hypothetical protein